MQNFNELSIISINPGYKTTGAFEYSLSTGNVCSSNHSMAKESISNPWAAMENSFFERNILKLAKKAVNLCRLCRRGY